MEAKDIESKARELAKDYAPTVENLTPTTVIYEAVMEMAKWMTEEKKPTYSKYEYIVGKKPKFSVGDILEYTYEDNYSKDIFFLGKIIKVEFDDEKQDWKYTFADNGDGEEESYEQYLIMNFAYTIGQQRYETYWLHNLK